MATNKVFVGDVGTEIVLDCGVDVTGATARKIIARKPSGTLVEWDAIAEGNNAIMHVTEVGDLNVAGEWQLQAKVELTGFSGLGDVVILKVEHPV